MTSMTSMTSMTRIETRGRAPDTCLTTFAIKPVRGGYFVRRALFGWGAYGIIEDGVVVARTLRQAFV